MCCTLFIGSYRQKQSFHYSFDILADINIIEMTENYVVEDVVKKKVENGQTFYRIKWKGYPSWQNTWEPAYHLPQDVIDFYEERQR
jgi:hypothetical protein